MDTTVLAILVALAAVVVFFIAKSLAAPPQRDSKKHDGDAPRAPTKMSPPVEPARMGAEEVAPATSTASNPAAAAPVSPNTAKPVRRARRED